MKKRLLITGAAGGMGRVCAYMAHEQGYSLVLADLPTPRLDELQEEFSGRGVATEKYPLDVTESDSIARMVAALENTGGADAVIHTVGVSPHMAPWNKIIDVDLVGTVAFLEALRPALNKGSATVCISSCSAYLCPADPTIEALLSDPLERGLLQKLETLEGTALKDPGLAYAYSKKALQKYVQRNASVWGAEGKRLSSLSPGLIETDMGKLEYDNWDQFEAMQARIALQRMGKPEDIAATALFLVSDAASYISGTDILVDGGLIASFGG